MGDMTVLVGILNVTPDSFSDGDLFLNPDKAIERATQLFKDGAGLVDVGAESTRPGATPLSPEIEWQRLKTVLQQLMKKYPGRLSLDTYHPETADKALNRGDMIINDVTGMNNPKMVEVVIKHHAQVIISHLRGTNIPAVHQGELISDIDQVTDDLLERAASLEDKGLRQEHIILDPGIGFGKTEELNRQLLEFARYVSSYKVMIGYSRKRFLGENRLTLEPNLEAGRIAIAADAAYLRVHDVAGHRQLVY